MRFLTNNVFRFIALFFTKTFFFVFIFFGACIKCKSLTFLLILPATVCIMQHPAYQNDGETFNSVNGPVNSTYKVNVFNKVLIFVTNVYVDI